MKEAKEATRLLRERLEGIADAVAQSAKAEAEQALADFIGPYLKRRTDSDRRMIEELKRDFPGEKAEKIPPVGKVRRRGRRTHTA